MATVSSVIDTILAEAGGSTPGERLEDMKAIASVIANRAAQLGVSLEDVVSVPSEFNAYGKAFPPGVEKYRALAARALQEVQKNGPTTTATFYATEKAAHRLPDGLEPVTETAGHQYFSDPEMRSIRTAQGFMQPDAGGAMLASYAPDERTSAEPSAFDALFGGYSANPQQSFTDQGAVSRQPGLLTQRSIATDGLLGVEREGYGSPFGLMGDRITSGFGGRAGPITPMGIGSTNHRGMDLSLQPNEAGYPVEASAGGKVTYAGPKDGYGNLVEIEHPDGMRTRYGHLQDIGNLAIGDQVARGTPVGMVGNTGRSRGPHLHFETRDALGNPVDPRTVVGFNSEVRVPTPEARPEEAWQSAAPIDVQRDALPEIGGGLLAQKSYYGRLADTMRQTPSLNLSGAGVDLGAAGRLVDNNGIPQGRAELRDAMLGSVDVGRATDAEMTAMQDEATRSRQAMEARMRGGMSLTPDQMATLADHRETAMGLLNKAGRLPATADLVDPVDYPGNVAHFQRLTGLSPTMTQSVSTAGMNPTADISRPLAETEYSGLAGNPGLLSAQTLGMEPNRVKTLDVDLLSQPKTAGMGVVEGPVSNQIQTPDATVKEDEAAATIQQPSRFGRFARNAGATLLGSVAGSALAGPAGAMIGGVLAREALGANNPQGGMLGGIGGLLGDRSGQGAWAGVGTLNDLGRGAQAAYGAWGGPKGTSGVATDGSRITSLGNGLVSRIDKFGRETLFRDGQTVGGGGGWGNGGLLGGLFGGNTGDGSRSQADRARDSVGLY